MNDVIPIILLMLSTREQLHARISKSCEQIIQRNLTSKYGSMKNSLIQHHHKILKPHKILKLNLYNPIPILYNLAFEDTMLYTKRHCLSRVLGIIIKYKNYTLLSKYFLANFGRTVNCIPLNSHLYSHEYFYISDEIAIKYGGVYNYDSFIGTLIYSFHDSYPCEVCKILTNLVIDNPNIIPNIYFSDHNMLLCNIDISYVDMNIVYNVYEEIITRENVPPHVYSSMINYAKKYNMNVHPKLMMQ